MSFAHLKGPVSLEHRHLSIVLQLQGNAHRSGFGVHLHHSGIDLKFSSAFRTVEETNARFRVRLSVAPQNDDIQLGGLGDFGAERFDGFCVSSSVGLETLHYDFGGEIER